MVRIFQHVLVRHGLHDRELETPTKIGWLGQDLRRVIKGFFLSYFSYWVFSQSDQVSELTGGFLNQAMFLEFLYCGLSCIFLGQGVKFLFGS